MDSDGPVSSGIDAASLSDSSLGSEILESLPSSQDGLGHGLLQNHPQTGGGVPLLRATMEKEVIVPPTTEFGTEDCTKADLERILKGEHRRLQYRERGPWTKSH